jgi:predicted nuclease of predicted toxin-antitoxin system
MKLLLDANISWRLVKQLKLHFIDCIHVDNTGLKVPAKDSEIWAYAMANEFVIVTNDDDFLRLSYAKGFPPKVIFLKTGNQSNNYLLALLIKYSNEISDFCESEETGVLEIFAS